MPRDQLDDWIDKALEADPLPMEIDEPTIERGPPLTDAELIVARDGLSKWHTPSEFISVTEDLCSRYGSEAWFSRPQLKFLHDAYVLAEFVRLTKVESVRLAPKSEQWPDGYVKIDGKVHNIEATSHHGGRKLGDEYGKNADHVPKFIDGAQTRADLIPKSLDEAIGGKAKKNYSSKCWLVVYLNISGWGLDEREIKKAIFATKERYSQKFEAISVLWNAKSF
jgi:hypothetical protein